jgi:FeS assembly protein SufD
MKVMSNSIVTTLSGNTQIFTVPANTVLENPIEMGCSDNSADSHYRIILEENTQATMTEFPANFSSPHTCNIEIILHKNAQLTYYKKYVENHVINTQVSVKQKAHSQFTSHVVCMYPETVSCDIHVFLEEEYANCTLNGITMSKEKQHVMHRTLVEHLKPHCTSNEYYKAILDNNAKCGFHGKVIVAENAIKTQATQSNKTLLLSRSAEINTQPELEIFSDDVQCTHGATVGQLDKEALFYLQARGIDKIDAQKLLIDAFIGDILQKMPLIHLTGENK